MKKLQKAFAVILTLAILAALPLTALASDAQPDTSATPAPHTVIFTDVGGNAEYKLYRILDKDSTDKGYTVPEKWSEFVSFDSESGTVSYGTTEQRTYIKEGNYENVNALLKYAADHNISPVKTITNKDGSTVSLSDMAYGYYLVDFGGGYGGLFYLNSNNPYQEVVVKSEPSIVKKIVLADGSKVDWTTVDIGDDVQFEVKVKLPSEYEWAEGTGHDYSYLCSIVDEVSSGLKMNGDTRVWLDGKLVESGKKISEATGDIISYGNNNDQHLWINFGGVGEDGSNSDPLFFLKLHPGANLTVTYSAKVIQMTAQTPEESNKATLWYGGKNIDDTVYVYDFSIIIDKHNAINNAPLSDAQFVLRNSEGKYYWTNGKGDNSYHVGDELEWVEATLDLNTGTFTDFVGNHSPSIWISNEHNERGKLHFEGIAAGEYDLIEIKAPEGFQKLDNPIHIKIEANKDSGFDGKNVKFTATVDGKTMPIEAGGVLWQVGWHQLRFTVDVPNGDGATLPTTGGTGTTLIYAAGAVPVAGAGVLLFAKRRSKG